MRHTDRTKNLFQIINILVISKKRKLSFIFESIALTFVKKANFNKCFSMQIKNVFFFVLATPVLGKLRLFFVLFKLELNNILKLSE